MRRPSQTTRPPRMTPDLRIPRRAAFRDDDVVRVRGRAAIGGGRADLDGAGVDVDPVAGIADPEVRAGRDVDVAVPVALGVQPSALEVVAVVNEPALVIVVRALPALGPVPVDVPRAVLVVPEAVLVVAEVAVDEPIGVAAVAQVARRAAV